MADKKSKKVASEVVGELRKAAKLYEVFKNAADAAELLANFEKNEAALKKSILSLEKDKESLEIVLSEALNEIEAVNAKAKEKSSQSDEVLANAKSEAKDITAKARENANAIIDKAQNEASKIESTISAIKVRERQAVEDEKKAQSHLTKVNEQIKAAKDKFLEIVG
jgi:cell division septum initiation protein DivIVA